MHQTWAASISMQKRCQVWRLRQKCTVASAKTVAKLLPHLQSKLSDAVAVPLHHKARQPAERCERSDTCTSSMHSCYDTPQHAALMRTAACPSFCAALHGGLTPYMI